MKKIAIIGANGQVGSEVCLLLGMMEDIEVVPVCRTQIGSAFLRRCGLPVQHAKASDTAAMRQVLAGCDLVADFSLPTGSASEVRATMREVIPSLSAAAPSGVPFVYLSSVTAFGGPDFHQPLKHYWFSRNMYGACKRYGERLAMRSARKQKRPGYVLRVGVVHGELQAVTRKTLQTVRTVGDRLTSVPDAESYTVFAFSIAEALVGIVNGREQPGFYTMLSNPGWSWCEVHEWYCRRAEVTPRLKLLAADPQPAAWKSVIRSMAAPVQKLVFAGKDVIASYLTAAMPAVENRLRAVYHTRNAAREIAAGARESQYRPYGNNHTVFPGQRLRSLSDSRVTMEPYASRVREILRRALRQDEMESVRRR